MLKGKPDNLRKLRKIGFLCFEKCSYWVLQGLKKWHGYLSLGWKVSFSKIPMICFILLCLIKTFLFFLIIGKQNM